MLKRFLIGAVVATCLLALASTALAVKTPVIPIFSQCKTKTGCSATAYTNEKYSQLQLTIQKSKCTSAVAILNSSLWGTLKPKGSTLKFSGKGAANIVSADGQTEYLAHVKINGKIKPKRSIKGSYTVTTDAPACASSTGKKQSFNLKYKGISHGG